MQYLVVYVYALNKRKGVASDNAGQVTYGIPVVAVVAEPGVDDTVYPPSNQQANIIFKAF